MIRTPRGIHVYLKKSPGDGEIGNRAWALDGFAGDVRCDHGYVIGWQLDKLAGVLDLLPSATPTAVDLFPKPAKGAGLHLVEGRRNNALNELIFRQAQSGQTEFVEERATAIASGLGVAEVDATIKSALPRLRRALDRSGPIRRMAVYEGKRGIASREPAKGPGAV